MRSKVTVERMRWVFIYVNLFHPGPPSLQVYGQPLCGLGAGGGDGKDPTCRPGIQSGNQSKKNSTCLGDHMDVLGRPSRPFSSHRVLLPASEIKKSLLPCVLNSYGALLGHGCFLYDPFFSFFCAIPRATVNLKATTL